MARNDEEDARVPAMSSAPAVTDIANRSAKTQTREDERILAGQRAAPFISAVKAVGDAVLPNAPKTGISMVEGANKQLTVPKGTGIMNPTQSTAPATVPVASQQSKFVTDTQRWADDKIKSLNSIPAASVNPPAISPAARPVKAKAPSSATSIEAGKQYNFDADGKLANITPPAPVTESSVLPTAPVASGDYNPDGSRSEASIARAPAFPDNPNRPGSYGAKDEGAMSPALANQERTIAQNFNVPQVGATRTPLRVT